MSTSVHERRNRCPLLESFGARVRWYRVRRGLSQTELALNIGYAREELSRVEAGRRWPPLARIHAIATALCVSVSDLFTVLPEKT